eukprot:6181535-Pleurochrysis_carterae.AAC.3
MEKLFGAAETAASQWKENFEIILLNGGNGMPAIIRGECVTAMRESGRRAAAETATSAEAAESNRAAESTSTRGDPASAPLVAVAVSPRRLASTAMKLALPVKSKCQR